MNIERMNFDINNDPYVKVFNYFVSEKEYFDKITGEITENKLSLTPEELYIYYVLNLRRNFFTNTTLTSIDLVSQQVQLLINENRNRAKIKDIIMSLRNKGIINFIFDEEEKDKLSIKKQYTLMIDISFKHFDNIGYEQIYYNSTFTLTNVPDEFFIICTLKVLNRTEISYAEFARRMKKSERHVKRVLKKMQEKELIIISSGPYIEKNQQEINKYYIASERDKFTEDREHRLFEYNSSLTAHDYYIWKTTKDPKVIKFGKKRFDGLKKKNPKEYNKILHEYEQIINNGYMNGHSLGKDKQKHKKSINDNNKETENINYTVDDQKETTETKETQQEKSNNTEQLKEKKNESIDTVAEKEDDTDNCVSDEEEEKEKRMNEFLKEHDELLKKNELENYEDLPSEAKELLDAADNCKHNKYDNYYDVEETEEESNMELPFQLEDPYN